MRTKIMLYGEIAGTIWMPAAECSKEFHLELVRIPRTSTTRTYPSIAPRTMEITRLRDALLQIINDGDFQSCSINWARLEISHYFGDESLATSQTRAGRRQYCSQRPTIASPPPGTARQWLALYRQTFQSSMFRIYEAAGTLCRITATTLKVTFDGSRSCSARRNALGSIVIGSNVRHSNCANSCEVIWPSST